MVGYNVQKKESLNSAYICPHCSLLLRDPIQLIDCGHRLCQSCVDEQKDDIIICTECQEKIPRKNLIIDRGFKNDMQTLSISCLFCEWIDILKNYQNHLDQVHRNPICNYCEEKFPTVNDFNQHQQYNCEKMTIYCPLKQFGCIQLILRMNLSEHYRSEQHQIILINVVHHLKTTLPNDMCNHSKISSEITEINETVEILKGGTEALDDDLKRLSTEAIVHKNVLDPLLKDLSVLKISSQEQNTFVDGIKINQEILQQDIGSMVQKVNEMKTNSYDGTLIWKISDIKAKIADAQSDKQTSIYSPPLYSSPTGYKMCARIYLNGDGNARGTHLSLFFVLMRSEYDAILKFPFNFKVTFCLYDQTNQQNHRIDSFRPDIRSNSFQRPRSDMNFASGLPKFVDLKILQQENNPYIRDDAIFIKMMIDFNEIEKTLLPYVLDLNPGFPILMQQTMIQQEMERRQQQQSLSPSMMNDETDRTLTISLPQTNTLTIDMNDKLIDPTNENIDLIID